jgi:hypothetical protein
VPAFLSKLADDCSCKDCSYGGVRPLGAVVEEEEEERSDSIGARLDKFHASKGANRAAFSEVLGAASGVAWAATKSVTHVSDGTLTCLFEGEAHGLAGEDDSDGLTATERSAWSILGFYFDHAALDLDSLKEELTAGLRSLTGTYAFVLVDRSRHRVVAAASPDGLARLAWGETPQNALLFGTTADSALSDVEATPFPPGCLFISSVADRLYDVQVNRACPGVLRQFRGAKDVLLAQAGSGALRRVFSRGSLARNASGADLKLIKSFGAGELRTTPSFSELRGDASPATPLQA